MSGEEPLVEICDRRARTGDLDIAWLRQRVIEAAGELACPVARVAVALLDDTQMTALHRDHSGIDATTDVLTFALSQPGEPIDADLAVCVDEAARQAAARGHATERELLLYCLHGLLHCAGYDDHSEEGYARMHAVEDEILRRLGVGPTFGGEPGGSSP